MLKNWLFQRKAAEDEKTKNIKIVYDDGVDQFVKNVIYNFCRNLERNYLFVDPLNIYVKNKLYIMVNDSDKVAGLFMRPRACLKIHSCHLHAPLCGIFAPNSGYIARYAPFIRDKSPTNWDAQLPESNFKTRSREEECAYIKFALGDYDELVRERGRVNAVVAILQSVSDSIVKYLAWTKNPYKHCFRLNRIIVREIAKIYGERLIDAYMIKIVNNGFIKND